MAGSGPDDRALLGRARELAVFGGLLADLDAGRGCCALIEGEPGIGKTALLEAVLGRARDAGFAVAHGVCREPDRDGPVRALVEALGLSAEWRSTAREREPAAPVASAVGRVLAAVELRCAAGPLVLAVDDLHRADEASLLLWQRLC